MTTHFTCYCAHCDAQILQVDGGGWSRRLHETWDSENTRWALAEVFTKHRSAMGINFRTVGVHPLCKTCSDTLTDQQCHETLNKQRAEKKST